MAWNPAARTFADGQSNSHDAADQATIYCGALPEGQVMSDLYDTDILLWSERQAELLRRSAAGERVNDGELDWPNIVEEIADVGRSELRSCRSL
jgi:hypothetical protein